MEHYRQRDRPSRMFFLQVLKKVLSIYFDGCDISLATRVFLGLIMTVQRLPHVLEPFFKPKLIGNIFQWPFSATPPDLFM